MPENWWMYFVAAIIPLLVGSVWYGPLFGKKWMQVNGYTEESLAGANMGVIFLLSFLFSVLMAFTIGGIVIHQSGVFQMMAPDVLESGSAAQDQFNSLMATYGDRYRGFGHGALHGAIIALLFVFPLIAINSLFERRGWTYIGIHTGYWLICLVLMGGVLCQFLNYGTLS